VKHLLKSEKSTVITLPERNKLQSLNKFKRIVNVQFSKFYTATFITLFNTLARFTYFLTYLNYFLTDFLTYLNYFLTYLNYFLTYFLTYINYFLTYLNYFLNYFLTYFLTYRQ